MKYKTDYRIFPLGDSAITVDFGNIIDEEINLNVLARYHQLTNDPVEGVIEIVPAYSSLTLHYDMLAVSKNIPKGKLAYSWICEEIEKRFQQSVTAQHNNGPLVKIPVCYDTFFAPDLASLAESKGMSNEEVVQLH